MNNETLPASVVSRFLRSEMGLQSSTALAEWRDDVLIVTLTEALTPIGHVAALTAGGEDLLETAYGTLYSVHQNRRHALLFEVIGQRVQQSNLTVDSGTGSFILTFAF